MTIKISIFTDKATAHGPFPIQFIKVLSSLSGRKIWAGSKQVSFESTASNLRKLRESDFDIRFDDKSGHMKELEELENMATQHEVSKLALGKYKPKVKLLKHMEQALALSHGREAYAYLLEMGLCKTAITLHDIGMLFLERKLTGALILAPKGVHRQWLQEAVPEQLDPQIETNLLLWRGSGAKLDWHRMNMKGKLSLFAMNIDAPRTTIGLDAARMFLNCHKGKNMIVLDESHYIKNPTADRTKAAIEISKGAVYKRILTGTPISKNIMDAWSQFKFLDERILGHKYAVSFRSRYCVMGGYEGREIVGQKNTEEFYRLIAPHSFRLTKREALGLPEKRYTVHEYEMGDETRAHYNSLRSTFMTALSDGTIVDVPNAAVALLRLQQIVLGYLPFKEELDGKTTNKIEIISHERIKVLINMCNQINGPTIIWSRFHEDVRRIHAALEKEFGKGCVVNYTGLEKDKEKDANKKKFMEGKAQFFNATAAAGGTGTDGLQKICENMIYYSNSFNALHRWQSEDRLHRAGMKGGFMAWDIRAARSVDGTIITNVKNKKSISDLTFDQIRQAIAASGE